MLRKVVLLACIAFCAGGLVKTREVKLECSTNGCSHTRWVRTCCFPWNGGDISMNPIDGVTTCNQVTGNFRNKSMLAPWLTGACLNGALWQGVGWGGWKTVCVFMGGNIGDLRARGRGWTGVTTQGSCKVNVIDSKCDTGFELENGCFVDGAGNEVKNFRTHWFQIIKSTGVVNVVDKTNGRGSDVIGCSWIVSDDGYRKSFEVETDEQGNPGEGGFGLQYGRGNCPLRGAVVPWGRCEKSCLVSKDGIVSCSWKGSKITMMGCGNVLTSEREVKGLCVAGKCNGEMASSIDGEVYEEVCQLGWGMALGIFSVRSGLWLGFKMCKGGLCGWVLLGIVGMWLLGVGGLHRVLRGVWRGKSRLERLKKKRKQEWCEGCEYWEDEVLAGWHGEKCEDRCPFCKDAGEEPGSERKECTERKKSMLRAEKKLGNEEKNLVKREQKFMRRGGRALWAFWFVWMIVLGGFWLGECTMEDDLVKGRTTSSEWWSEGVIEGGGKGGDVSWGKGEDTVVTFELDGEEEAVRVFKGERTAWLEISGRVTCWATEDRGEWVDSDYVVNTAFDCTGDCSNSVNTALDDGSECHWDKRWEHDTNWGCNPGWCWSISQGCFGARASLLPKDKLKVLKKLRGAKSGRKVCWGGADECVMVARGTCVSKQTWSACLDGDEESEYVEVQDNGSWWRLNSFCDQNCRQGDVGDYMNVGGKVSCPEFDGQWSKVCATATDPKAELSWDGTAGVTRWRKLRDESELNTREKVTIDGYVCERGAPGKDKVTVKVGGTPEALKKCDWKCETGQGKGTWGSQKGFDVDCIVSLSGCDSATATVELCDERACFGGVQLRAKKGKTSTRVHGKGSDGIRGIACCIGDACGDKSFKPDDPDFVDVKHYNTTRGKSKGEGSSCDWKCQIVHWWDGISGFFIKFWIEILFLLAVSFVAWWVIGREKKRSSKKDE